MKNPPRKRATKASQKTQKATKPARLNDQEAAHRKGQKKISRNRLNQPTKRVLTVKQKETARRNNMNAQLTRVKERILIPYLKSLPHLYMEYHMNHENQPIPKWAHRSIKHQALKIAYSEFIEFQSCLKGSLFSTEADLEDIVRSQTINFAANLLTFSQQDLFLKDKGQIMGHEPIQNSQVAQPWAAALLNQVQRRIEGHLYDQPNGTQEFKVQNFQVNFPQVQNKKKQVQFKRVSMGKLNFKSLFYIVILAIIGVLDTNINHLKQGSSSGSNSRLLQQQKQTKDFNINVVENENQIIYPHKTFDQRQSKHHLRVEDNKWGQIPLILQNKTEIPEQTGVTTVFDSVLLVVTVTFALVSLLIATIAVMFSCFRKIRANKPELEYIV